MGRQGDGSTLPRVRSVSRAFAVLRSFDRSEPELLPRTIAERTGLDTATTRRLLATLEAEGLVSRNSDTSRYRLTTGLLLLADAVTGDLSLRDFAHDHLVALADISETTVFLSAFINGKMVCVDKVLGGSPIDIKWWGVNESLPINCGAAPKLMLAYLPEDQAKEVSKPENFVALSPNSVMDPVLLEAQLQQARAQGWILSEDDVSDGLSALAAPVFNAQGAVIAAVSMGGLTPQVSAGSPPRLLSPLLECARKLTDFCRSQRDTLPLVSRSR